MRWFRSRATTRYTRVGGTYLHGPRACLNAQTTNPTAPSLARSGLRLVQHAGPHREEDDQPASRHRPGYEPEPKVQAPRAGLDPSKHEGAHEAAGQAQAVDEGD